MRHENARWCVHHCDCKRREHICAKQVSEHGASARNLATPKSSESTARPHEAEANVKVSAAQMRVEKGREAHPPTRSPKRGPRHEPCWLCTCHKLIAPFSPIVCFERDTFCKAGGVLETASVRMTSSSKRHRLSSAKGYGMTTTFGRTTLVQSNQPWITRFANEE